MTAARAALIALLALAAAAGAMAQAPAQRALDAADLQDRIGVRIPRELGFVDQRNRKVVLGQYLERRPLILAPVWYGCGHMCGAVLGELTAAVAELDLVAGRDFDVVAVSIDPGEDAAVARGVERELLAPRRPGAAGWHLLTGAEGAIRRLTSSIGFVYRYDPRTEQYAHPAVLTVVSPDGRVTRYLPGVGYRRRDLELSLLEAGQGQLGSFADRLLLRCFNYDPESGRYGLAILTLLRLLGVATVALIAVLLIRSLLRERRRGS